MIPRSPFLLLVALSTLFLCFMGTSARAEIELDYDLDTGDIFLIPDGQEPIRVFQRGGFSLQGQSLESVEVDGSKADYVWKDGETGQFQMTSEAKIDGNSVRFENQFQVTGVDEERLNRLVFTVGLEKELNSSEDLTDVTISFDGQAAIDFTEFKDKGMSLEQIRDELKQPMRQRQFSTLLQNAREVTISGIQGKTLKFTLDSPPYFDFGVILTEQRRWLTLRMTTYRGSDVGGESSVSAGTANWTLQVE